jgi:hypothetical protein
MSSDAFCWPTPDVPPFCGYGHTSVYADLPAGSSRMGIPALPTSLQTPMRSTTNHAQQLITLWIAWLLALLFHVDLGLMPLFRGQSPEINSQVPLGSLPLLFGARCTP